MRLRICTNRTSSDLKVLSKLKFHLASNVNLLLLEFSYDHLFSCERIINGQALLLMAAVG